MERDGEKEESSYHVPSDRKAKKVQAILEWKNEIPEKGKGKESLSSGGEVTSNVHMWD